MPLREAEAFVLRTWPLRESDKIVSFFTREFGKCRGVARGARRPKSKFGAMLEPLSQTRLRFFEREGRDLGNIDNGELLASMAPVAASGLLAALVLGCIAETAERMLPERESNPAVYRLLALVLEALRAAPRGGIGVCPSGIVGAQGRVIPQGDPPLGKEAARDLEVSRTARLPGPPRRLRRGVGTPGGLGGGSPQQERLAADGDPAWLALTFYLYWMVRLGGFLPALEPLPGDARSLGAALAAHSLGDLPPTCTTAAAGAPGRVLRNFLRRQIENHLEARLHCWPLLASLEGGATV